jgi:ferrochelatase
MSPETQETQGPVGVLLMAYGSPNSLDEVLPYYTDVRGGRPPTAEQLAVVYDHYARIGGPTGLLAISQAQASALQARLNADAPGAYRVYLGMRHWRPYIADTVRQMAKDGVRQAVAIALAPQDSRISVGGYIASVEKALDALAQERSPQTDVSEAPAPAIRFSFVRSWHDEPHFLRLLAERVAVTRERAFSPAEHDAVHVIFSAHSLPERITTWNDPYPTELRATVAGVAQRLGLDEAHWTFAYQSAGRTSEPWLGPSIQEVLPRLIARGVHSALVCPVGFISDNLEILYDLDIELRDQAQRQGLHLERIPMPNADPLLIEALANVTLRATRANAEMPA